MRNLPSDSNDHPARLVAQHERLGTRPVDHVELAVADPGRPLLDEDLPGAGLRQDHGLQVELMLARREDGDACRDGHGRAMLAGDAG